MQSRSYLFLLLVLVLAGLSSWLFVAKDFKYGLDVRGGIRLTYQLQFKADQQNKADIQTKLVTALEKRAQGFGGTTEATVVKKGNDQVIVEIPGATNITEARTRMGTSARVYFYDAKNVSTPTSRRLYEAAPDNTDPNDPVVNFRRTVGDDTLIKPTIKDADGKLQMNPAYLDIIKGWGTEILSGDDLEKADSEPSGTGTYHPHMLFSATGSEKMSKWSNRYYDTGENLAYVMDNRVLNIAPLKNGARISSEAIIEGNFSTEYVKTLSDLLNAGSLPVDLKELSYESVDPTIGKTALSQIVTAGAIALGATGLFLLAYYAFPGFVAMIALLLYVLFTLSVMKAINATFSLAAIAGFILSVGMAVDANILVFERFKEEMKRGRTLTAAIDLGFRRALPAIVDSNACTILTSMVLASLGTGAVKGFATTLIIGVLVSLFTAVFVTRSLLMFFVNSGLVSNVKLFAVERNWFKKLEARADTEPLQVVEKWKRWFWISALTILVCVPFFFIGGFKQNVEFRGGFEFAYSAPADLTTAQIVAKLEKAGIKGANVKLGASQNAKVAYLTIPTEGVKNKATADVDVAQAAGFGAIHAQNSSFVGPTVQAETIRNAIMAVIFSSVLIIVYLALRFGFSLGGFVPGLRFGFSAVGALVHDVLVVIGSAAVVGYLMGWEISALFITAMLTVIGFSVHDTIVVFDRMRENLRRPDKHHDLGFVMDKSITQSFARSVNTSMTVVATLLILIVIGTPTPDLKFFCVAMVVGIASGTYSSIYNASPILYLWDKVVTKKDPKKGLIGLALDEMAKSRVVQTQVSTAQAPQVQSQETGRTYGQVRRRASAQEKGHIEIEDEP